MRPLEEGSLISAGQMKSNGQALTNTHSCEIIDGRRAASDEHRGNQDVGSQSLWHAMLVGPTLFAP